MITARRKITNEQQRFGGYAVQPTAVTVRERPLSTRRNVTNGSTYENTYAEPAVTDDYATDNRMLTNTDFTYTRQTVADTQTTYEQTRPYEYTYEPEVAQAPAAPQVIRYTQRGEQPQVAVTQKKKNQTSENIVHNVYGQPQEAEPVKEERRQSKMSVKNKVALFAYIGVVLVLAVMVIATGLAVSNINARADELQNEIEYKSEIVAEQKSQIAVLTNHEHIIGAALGNDMEVIDPDTALSVEIIPETDPIVYQGRTNWFDKFCDFLSNIVGG